MKYIGKKLNILQINTLDNIGGAAKVALGLYNKYKEKRHNSHLLVGTKILEDSNISELKRKESKLKNFITNNLGLEEFSIPKDRALLNNNLFRNSDVVNLHNLHGNYFNMNNLISISKEKPVVWTFHDMWPITGHCAHSFDCERWRVGCGKCPYLDTYPKLKIDLSRYLWKRKKKIYSKSDFTIVVPSKWLMQKVKKSILKDKKIELIYNGVDERTFTPGDSYKLRKELGLPLNRKILIFISHGGVNNLWKGKEYLTRMIKWAKRKKDIIFLEVGSNELSQTEDNFIRVPYIEDKTLLAKYYAAADLFLLTSIAENCPLVVLEAMACGVPVVSFDVGGVKELVKHMKTGYIAEHKSVDDLVKGLNLFLSDDNLLEKTRIDARKRIEKYFTLELQTQKYLKLYKDLIKRR